MTTKYNNTRPSTGSSPGERNTRKDQVTTWNADGGLDKNVMSVQAYEVNNLTAVLKENAPSLGKCLGVKGQDVCNAPSYDSEKKQQLSMYRDSVMIKQMG